MPDPHRFDHESIKFARAERAAFEQHNRDIAEARDALRKAWGITTDDTDDQPPTPPRSA